MDRDWKSKKWINIDFQKLISWRFLITKRNFSEQFLKWIYLESPFGPAHLWVIFDKEEIIAQNSFLPIETYYNSRLYKSALNFDISTHPKYRFLFFEKNENENKKSRFGLFHIISSESIEGEEKENCAFIIGFPNEKPVLGHLKMGWVNLGRRPILEKMVTETHVNCHIQKYNFVEISKFELEFDYLTIKQKIENLLIRNRNSRYLNWRYCAKPDERYWKYKILKHNELIGFLILKIYNSSTGIKCHVVDFLFPQNDEILFNEVIQLIYDFAQKKNAYMINVMINSTLNFTKYLLKNGFYQDNNAQLFMIRNNNMSSEIGRASCRERV